MGINPALKTHSWILFASSASTTIIKLPLNTVPQASRTTITMLSMQYLVLCLTAGLLQPALAVPLTVDVSITVDGDTVTSSSSAVSDDDSAGSSDDTTSSYWPSDSTYCNGTAYNEDLLDTYVCGDWRLGPVQLPSEAPPISTSEINTYNQLGSYEPADFLQDFWNDTEYDWIYPPENGFIIDAVTGEPITGTFELQSDAYIDSFATNIRGLLYPASTPYQQRSLPPSNLDASESDPQ